MAENKHQTPEMLPPEARHEHADVNVWAVGKFGIALVLLCILAMAMLAGVFRLFESMDGGGATRIATTVKLPPAPTLEKTPYLDLKAFRAAEDQVLNSYGWVDQPNGLVRIPIDRAIDLLAQRGLPARTQMPPSTDGNASVPTESSLGPKMQQPGGPLAGDVK